MKNFLILLLSLMACWNAQGVVAEASLAMAVVGEVDPALAERVRAFAEENLALPVRLLEPCEAAEAASLNAIGEAAAQGLGEADVCLVVLAAPVAPLPNHGIMMPEIKTAVINVPVLKPEDGDAERFGRRVEREAMMSIGLLLGLETCPNPQCAMWLYSNNEELDAKGRNYCPPCLDRVQKLAAGKGIKAIAGSPFAPLAEESIPGKPAPEEQGPEGAGEPEPIEETP